MPAALISLKREKKKQCEGGAKKKKTREAEENGRAFRAIIEAGDYPVRSNCFGGGGGGDGPRCSPAVWCRVRGRAGLVGKQPSVFFFASQKANGKRRPALRSGRCWPLAGPPERMEETTSGMWKVPLIVALGPTRGLPPGRDPQTHTQTHTCTMP